MPDVNSLVADARRTAGRVGRKVRRSLPTVRIERRQPPTPQDRPQVIKGGNARMAGFTRMLNLLPGGTLLDLGAGHGKFSVRAADLGWKVTAVDARTSRFPDDSRITWVQEDIRTFDVSGFDVVACLGLLYHLGVADQVDLLTRCSGAPLLLDTHVANGRNAHPLGPETVVDGYRGRFYKEANIPTSSWGNRTSFWVTEPELYRMLADCGFPSVLTLQPWWAPDRTFFLALPRGRVKSQPRS